MKTKDFREIQVSSTLLVIIFLCVLVLGVFIFLLGVSVGKKQVQIAAATQVVAQQIQEPAKDQAAGKPAEPAQDQVKSGPETGLTTSSPLSGSQGKPGVQEKSAKTSSESVPPVKEAQKPAPKASAPPATKTPSKPAASAGTGLFYIQVAAFTDRAQAAAEADKFRKRGLPVVVADPRPTDTKSWYRVRVGGFTTREKAAAALTKLNEAAKKKTDYRIVKD
jgi:cell division septation protein DedD